MKHHRQERFAPPIVSDDYLSSDNIHDRRDRRRRKSDKPRHEKKRRRNERQDRSVSFTPSKPAAD